MKSGDRAALRGLTKGILEAPETDGRREQLKSLLEGAISVSDPELLREIADRVFREPMEADAVLLKMLIGAADTVPDPSRYEIKDGYGKVREPPHDGFLLRLAEHTFAIPHWKSDAHLLALLVDKAAAQGDLRTLRFVASRQAHEPQALVVEALIRAAKLLGDNGTKVSGWFLRRGWTPAFIPGILAELSASPALHERLEREAVELKDHPALARMGKSCPGFFARLFR